MPQFTDVYAVTIHYEHWPVEHPRAVVQIAHGVGEHSGRYAQLAAALNAQGYSVYADDHRGHGRTGVLQHDGDLSRLGRLGPGGLRATELAISRLTAIISDENPGVPIVLLGHSWGSLMAQRIVNTRSSDYDLVVLSGTAYRMPGSMNGGDLSKPHAVKGGSGLEWLSRDESVWKAFADDPLTFTNSVLDRFGPADALRLFGRPALDLVHDVPVLIMVGDADSLGGERSARALATAYRTRSKLSDVSVRIYPGARHEVFQEINRDEVTADLVRWLDERLPPRPASSESESEPEAEPEPEAAPEQEGGAQ